MNDMTKTLYQLAPDLTICRIVNGMWQIAGGHGYIDHELAIVDMMRYHDAGFTSWDLADIYGPAEDFIGEFRNRLLTLKGNEELERIQALTKWVPRPGRITRSTVKEAIERSLRRMNVSALDLLQFHWWDYNNPYYIDALKHLSDLRDEGRIRHIGLTNFDTERMQVIHDSNIPIVSNQVQYSIIDQRPEVKMIQFCKENNKSLFAYGTICGGLLSERYLGMSQEPSSQKSQICPTCGTRLSENAARCLVCGTELTAKAASKSKTEGIGASRMPEITLSLPMALGALTAVLLIGVWFLMQLVNLGAVVHNPQAQAGGGVAYAAHVGGFIFGAVTARLFERRGLASAGMA